MGKMERLDAKKRKQQNRSGITNSQFNKMLGIFDDRIGRSFKDEKGNRHTYAGSLDGHNEVQVRDWYNSSDEAAFKMEGFRMIDHKVQTGVSNIRANKDIIMNSKGVNELPPFKNNTAILIGAGGSLLNSIFHLEYLHSIGTTIATNRALKAFVGMEQWLDYAFLCDSQSNFFTSEEWWDILDKTQTKGIVSFNVHPSCLEFSDHYFFGNCSGYVKEWREELENMEVDVLGMGALDAGWSNLYSKLHLCMKKGVKKIILVGHDFSFANNLKYFDRPFHLPDEEKNMIANPVEFGLTIRQDAAGNLIVSQRTLEIQAKAMIVALSNMAENGVKIINTCKKGLLYGDFIEQVNLEELV